MRTRCSYCGEVIPENRRVTCNPDCEMALSDKRWYPNTNPRDQHRWLDLLDIQKIQAIQSIESGSPRSGIWQFNKIPGTASAQAPVRNNRYITASVRRTVMKRDAGQCVRCGSREELQFDHIYPVNPADGSSGHNDVDNIQLLCGPCNRRKSNT